MGLRDFFRSDAFVPTAAVFPAIDSDQIASELGIVSEGQSRGARGEPRPSDDELDIIERRIIERVGELRRKGLDNYAANKAAYEKRLTRAGEARKEAEFVAGKAKGDFQAAVKIWKARMATPRARVGEAFHALHAFRRRHRLDRPAFETQPVSRTIFFALFLILIESGLNAGLFAQANPSGLLGGAAIAGLISIINVASGSLTAYFARNAGHVNWFRKAFGSIVVVVGFVWIVAFNLTVAHFRDALERVVPSGGALGTGSTAGMADFGATDWDSAARLAWDRMVDSPFAIESAMSALLVALGLLVALASVLKMNQAMDPYPGYERVETVVRRARTIYAEDLTQAIESLDAARDEAIATLQDANTQMRLGINEAVDALFGQTSLRGELDRFLGHCDIQVQLLLETYRDANRRARGTRAKHDEKDATAPIVPPHFARSFVFPSHSESMPAELRRDEALREREYVGDMVTKSIAEIFEAYQASISAYADIDDLETSEPAHARASRVSRSGETRVKDAPLIASSQERSAPKDGGSSGSATDDLVADDLAPGQVALLRRGTSREKN